MKVGGTMALITAKESIQRMVAFKAMAADQVALASIEVKMEEIPEGQTKTYEWQGKPVFVKHRTAKEIQHSRDTAMSELRHPESDEQRTRNPEWSILVGVCTHLGCVPIRKYFYFFSTFKKSLVSRSRLHHEHAYI
ncbi:unnamed protein product [Anisakis simplex]|uniref:Cytochrome b-c1 complex subunit Rieske, mitochondrial n=1 Tax=Anisakis simplex TaxID=6269 RepID=A0A0M3JDS2_ANISI|nr:unnamed protein product [Anisakis simplex]